MPRAGSGADSAHLTVSPRADVAPVARDRRRAGRAVAWLSKQAEVALAGVDLTLAQYRVLGVLAEGSAMSSAISDRLAVRPPSVTALVDGLVARGLVDRHADTGDRRRVAVTVTPAGLDVLAAADSAVDARLVGIAGWLGDDDGGLGALDDLGRWSGALRARHAAEHGSAR